MPSKKLWRSPWDGGERKGERTGGRGGVGTNTASSLKGFERGLVQLTEGSRPLPLLPLREHYLLRQERFATKQPNLTAVISRGKEHKRAVNTSTTFQAPGLPEPRLQYTQGAQVSCQPCREPAARKCPSVHAGPHPSARTRACLHTPPLPPDQVHFAAATTFSY